MHQTLADFAGLSLGLELLGDLLQKLGPPLLIDRPSQAHQNAHFVVVQLQRRWHVRAAPCAGARTMTTRRRRVQEAGEDMRAFTGGPKVAAPVKRPRRPRPGLDRKP